MFYRLVLFVFFVFTFNAEALELPRQESVLDRFIRYVKIDTQSDDNSLSVPTSENQRVFAKILFSELKSLGLHQVNMVLFMR